MTIEEEMQRSYLDYAMSVIVSRALPDIRDGLKPVHRRILYAMKEGGYDATHAYRKSARIVGEVMGKYHPHGDQAIYDALVRMAQLFSMRLPLIDGQGNFGSMDGDPPAAFRYTEARLARTAEALLDDIDKATVDFQANYDDTDHEPAVLPARYPNLLVNGAGGIAVGMATNIPPHNLGEVLDACVACIDNPEISIDELMELVPGPDFPTGALIMGQAGIISAYHTGRGSVIMRSRTTIESLGNDREAIIVTELPYQVNKARLVERIAEVVREKIVEGISDLRDESDRDGVRVVIELRRDAMTDVVLAQLYRSTPAADQFWRQHARPDGWTAVNRDPAGYHPCVRRIPRGSYYTTDRLRTAARARSGTCIGRAFGGDNQSRSGHRADSRGQRSGNGARTVDDARLGPPAKLQSISGSSMIRGAKLSRASIDCPTRKRGQSWNSDYNV